MASIWALEGGLEIFWEVRLVTDTEWSGRPLTWALGPLYSSWRNRESCVEGARAQATGISDSVSEAPRRAEYRSRLELFIVKS